MSAGKRMPRHQAFLLWFNTVAAALSWPLFLWVAITQDWTVFFIPLAVSALAGMMWLALRREYGSLRQVRR